MKITAIMGGGDWNDAGVDFVIIPPGPSIEELHTKYKEWQEGWRAGTEKKFYTFVEWLKEFAGTTEPTEDQLEEYWEV
jgi:hypothetical protein